MDSKKQKLGVKSHRIPTGATVQLQTKPELQTEYGGESAQKEQEAEKSYEEQEILDLFQQVEREARILANDKEMRVMTAPRITLPGPEQIFLGSAKQSRTGQRKKMNITFQNEDIADVRDPPDFKVPSLAKNLRENTLTSSLSKRDRTKNFKVLPTKIQNYGEFQLTQARRSVESVGSESFRTSAVTTPFLFSNRYPQRASQLRNSYNSQRDDNTNQALHLKEVALNRLNSQGSPQRYFGVQYLSKPTNDKTSLLNDSYKTSRVQTQVSKRFRGRKLLQSEHSTRFATDRNQLAWSFDVQDSLIQNQQQHQTEPSMMGESQPSFKQISVQLHQCKELEDLGRQKNYRQTLARRAQLIQQQKHRSRTINLKQIQEDADRKVKQLTIMAITMNQEIPIVCQAPQKQLEQKKSYKMTKKEANYKLDYSTVLNNRADHQQHLMQSLHRMSIGQKDELEQRSEVIQHYLQKVRVIQQDIERGFFESKSAGSNRLVHLKRRKNNLWQAETLDAGTTDATLLMEMSQFIQQQ